MARALRARGFQVVLAGRGPHTPRVRQAGFPLYDVETMPQARMDRHVEAGDYGYYDMPWIDRCVRSERRLLRDLQPHLVIHDMRPAAAASARLEGVDDARVGQAYQQPGYAHPISLPDGFAVGGGPFDEYLALHASEVRPQRSFHLLADIPEFHPPGRPAPGYHYVGPLVERPVAPAVVEVLDAGWDTSLPLLYVTCGSSGREPTYLEGLVDAMRDRPWRLLVTTAGRWRGRTAHARVRVVDYVPGEWVLQRASLLLGVPGIGAIYQALNWGVPIIGAPEHLDQEYHLNQVARLGVGLKLDRRDLGGGRLLEAAEAVLGQVEQYRQRCAPFVGCLDRWDGGRLVADLVSSHCRARHQVYRAERAYLVPEGEFVRYLDTSTPRALSRRSLRRMLRRGVKRGLPHVRGRGGLQFDQLDSWNWLYDHEPAFFAADYRANEEKRQRFLVAGAAGVTARSAWQQYRATYRLQILPDPAVRGRRLRLFLPVPVERDGLQQGVVLASAAPSDMAALLSPRSGFIYGYPAAAADGAGTQTYEYTCEVRVAEASVERASGPARLAPAERRRHLELDRGLLLRPALVGFRRHLGERRGCGDLERARAIYRALVGRTRFRKTKDRSQGQTYSTVAVLTEPGGHCVTLSRAFIALCRTEGIPAREVTGALLGYPDGRDRYAMRTYGEPIWGHTWCEIHVEGLGWVPVEFHGVALGERALTGSNVVDAELARLVQENSSRYLDYYFGHVDNHRLLCSTAVSHVPEILIEHPEHPEGDPRRWQSADLRCDRALEIECL